MLRKFRRRNQGKKRPLERAALLTVLAVFAAVYILSMLLSTYLVQREFADEYMQAEEEIILKLQGSESGFEFNRQTEIISSQTTGKDFLSDILGSCEMSDGQGFHLISAAVYDGDGNLFVQSAPQLAAVTDREKLPRYSSLSDYFSREEIDQLARYATMDSLETADKQEGNMLRYDIQIVLAKDRRRPGQIKVEEELWRRYESQEEAQNELAGPGLGMEIRVTAQGEAYGTQVGSGSIVWEWDNPDITDSQLDAATFGSGSYLIFPGEEGGYEAWKKWEACSYLQEFPQKAEKETSLPETTVSGCRREQKFSMYLPENLDESGKSLTLVVRSESHPWMAAADQLKYVYLGGFLFVAGCGAFTLWVLEKTYRQRERMEEQRRSFINVMAHEIKTPLGVIRGFSENIRENPHSGKRDYYLDQMIRQTEEIDSLVKDMIAVTRMDWEQLRIKKTPVSLEDILNRETERIMVQAEEKRIQIASRIEGDWTLNGDQRLLEQAFYNLLSNAADYNRQEGWIRIQLEDGRCSIENSGTNIPAEHLSHICELFYTVQQKTGGREKHLGMGLYLSNQIFQQHGLRMKIENTGEGVCATVEK